jgi:DNA-directed RNA polymerase alpha subunit
MNISKRDKQILEMRKKGAFYRSIAESFGISKERAKVISKTVDQRNNWPEFRKLLSVRTQNVLLTYFRGNEEIFENPQRIAEFSQGALFSLRNMGKKSIQELAIALRAFGFSLKTDGKFFPDPGI